MNCTFYSIYLLPMFISLFLFFHNCHELIIFCHILYISNHINLIIKEEAHLLLTVGNKIVTKKQRNSLSGGLLMQR